MKLKKLLAGVLLVSMAAAIIGCSQTPKSEGSTKPGESQSGSVEGAKTDDVKLKLQLIGASPADLKQVQDAMNEYTSKNLGLTVDMVYTDFGDFDQKAQMIINSGEDYDIIFTCSWANDYLTNARKGAFLDLTPYLESDKYKALYDAIDPAFWAGAKVDGSIYAIPTQKEIAIMPMYMFNKELATKADFDYTKVKKLADTEPFLQYVKENNPEAIPFNVFGDRGFRGSYDYILGFGYPIAVDNEGKVQYMYDLPEVKDYAVTMRDFFQKGYVNQDAATKKGEMQVGELFGQSYADGQPYAEVIWSSGAGFEVVAAEMQVPIATTSTTRGAMLAINKNSKNPEAALDLLQAINTDSTLHNLLNYGIEGVHYDKVSENKIKRTEAGVNNYLVPTFALGNLFNTYLLDGEADDKWEVFKKANAEAKKSDLLGLDIDTSNIKNELAAINNLRLQYEPLLMTGSVDFTEKSEEFRTKLNEVGMQKVMDEVQKQVDAFLKK